MAFLIVLGINYLNICLKISSIGEIDSILTVLALTF